jgi:hypothetical protein
VIVGIDDDRAGRFPAVKVDDGAAVRLGDRRIGVTTLASNSLSRGLKLLWLVAS